MYIMCLSGMNKMFQKYLTLFFTLLQIILKLWAKYIRQIFMKKQVNRSCNTTKLKILELEIKPLKLGTISRIIFHFALVRQYLLQQCLLSQWAKIRKKYNSCTYIILLYQFINHSFKNREKFWMHPVSTCTLLCS